MTAERESERQSMALRQTSILDGSAILMQTSSDGSRIDFFYDDKGNVFAMKYQNEMYFYAKSFWGYSGNS